MIAKRIEDTRQLPNHPQLSRTTISPRQVTAAMGQPSIRISVIATVRHRQNVIVRRTHPNIPSILVDAVPADTTNAPIAFEENANQYAFVGSTAKASPAGMVIRGEPLAIGRSVDLPRFTVSRPPCGILRSLLLYVGRIPNGLSRSVFVAISGIVCRRHSFDFLRIGRSPTSRLGRVSRRLSAMVIKHRDTSGVMGRTFQGVAALSLYSGEQS